MRHVGWVVMVAIALAACQPQAEEPSAEGTNGDDSNATALEKRLVLDNATLNQAGDDGSPLWRIKAARVTYSPGRRDAEIEDMTGNFYQDGEVALQIQAERGRIVDEGEEVRLIGAVSATDPRNEAVLRCEEAIWRPDENVLVLRQNLRGTHPQLEATADEGRYYAEREAIELSGTVKAIASDPPLRLQAEALTWSIPEELATSADPIEVERYREDTITERVRSDRAEVDLAAEEVRLRGNVELRALDPELQVASDDVLWQTEAQRVFARAPVRALYEGDIDVSGETGEFDLAAEVAIVEGNVRGSSNENRAQLAADRLRWELPTQQVEATGNVIYAQAEPPVTTAGESASGNLRENTIVVRSGNDRTRVVTEFVP